MLTKKQLRLFKFIKKYKKQHEFMPSFEEMKDFMNVVSKSSVYQMLGCIEWKGFIKRLPARARAIEIIKEIT